MTDAVDTGGRVAPAHLVHSGHQAPHQPGEQRAGSPAAAVAGTCRRRAVRRCRRPGRRLRRRIPDGDRAGVAGRRQRHARPFQPTARRPVGRGRILAAALWWIRGDRAAARRTVGRAGILLGTLLMLAGFGGVLLTANLGGLWLVILGWFLTSAARTEAMDLTLHETLAEVLVADVMSVPAACGYASQSVADFIATVAPGTRTAAIRYSTSTVRWSVWSASPHWPGLPQRTGTACTWAQSSYLPAGSAYSTRTACSSTPHPDCWPAATGSPGRDPWPAGRRGHEQRCGPCARTGRARGDPAAPDPEVPAKARTRSDSAAYQARILEEYDGLDKAGKGALLRREGLYTSLISAWRQQRDQAGLAALAKPAGRPRAAVVSRVAPLATWRRLGYRHLLGNPSSTVKSSVARLVG
jgi:hypothetical protein